MKDSVLTLIVYIHYKMIFFIVEEKLRFAAANEMMIKDLQLVEIFTDGACSGNPGPGGWGALMRYGSVEKELSGGAAETTNNRMEMMAVIMALEALKRPSKVRLTTDSKYVKDGVTQWLEGWVRRGWKTADKKPVKNVDLWQRLQEAIKPHDLEILWVRGHNGHEENERVDALAVAAIPRNKN